MKGWRGIYSEYTPELSVENPAGPVGLNGASTVKRNGVSENIPWILGIVFAYPRV